MVRIAISVEGQTEWEFVDIVFKPYFRIRNIDITPVIVCTKRECAGKKHLGGDIRPQRIKEELEKLLPCFDYVTTLYDFYGFKENTFNNVDDLEKYIHSLMSNDRKLIPYVQKYEFESLVFCNPEYIGEELKSNIAKVEVEQIISNCGEIENINNSRETAPSKRLEKLFDKYGSVYDKVYHGPLITEETGIERIKELCPRFKNWIQKIELLGSSI